MNPIPTDNGLLCHWPGCRNRWTCDFSHGRLCSHHDAMASRGGASRPTDSPVRHQAPIPLRDAVRSFAEPEDRDDEYVHDDTLP